MKKIIRFTLLIMVLVTVAISCAFGSVSGMFAVQEESFNLWHWFLNNWSVVALVVSEIAALLPSRVSGIIHFCIDILGRLIDRTRTK